MSIEPAVPRRVLPVAFRHIVDFIRILSHCQLAYVRSIILKTELFLHLFPLLQHLLIPLHSINHLRLYLYLPFLTDLPIQFLHYSGAFLGQ